MEHEEQARVEKDHDTTARQQAEKEKHPKPADYAQTDKEQAQKRGEAKERKSESTD